MEAQILIVDDDRENGKFLQEELTQKGYARAAWFGDPMQALKSFRKMHYDIGILDLKLPRMSGVDLLRELRRLKPELGAIVLTGYPSVDTALATMKTGAFDYVKKPFDITHLRGVIKNLLEQKGFYQDNDMAVSFQIGRRIREIRQERQWTVSKLAEKTRLSKSLISQLENAKNSPSIVSLTRIAQSLNVRLVDIFRDI